MSSARPSVSHQTELDQWLSSLGFSQGNPFATAEADQERALLPEFFVEVEGYERIKGDQTIIVFAPRGGGKSALRVVLASQAAPISAKSTTLAIEYTDFDALIAKKRAGQTLTIDDYVPRLLRAGLTALLATFCGSSMDEFAAQEDAVERQYRAKKAGEIPPPDRSRMAQLVRSVHPSLLTPERLYNWLRVLDPKFAPDWQDFVQATAERHLHALMPPTTAANKIADFLADLNDYPDTIIDSTATAADKMRSFVQLAQAVGLTPVQFLIDRLDEMKETVDDPESQADVLEPLLTHLPLLEMPGIAFKFSLSQEARDILMERSTIRRDRLTDQAVTVDWNKNRLKHLLDERLNVFSEGRVHELTQLCQEIRIQIGRGAASMWLGEWIEHKMLQLAQRSPRRLLVAGQLLCQAHVRRSGATGLLGKEDWETAKSELMQKMPPLLRLQRDERIALVGDRIVQLTHQQHKILLALADSRGQCGREDLADTVWGTTEGVSDEAIDRAIGRLREKLGDDPSSPVHLGTERGEGFKLLNYAIE